MRVTLPEPSQAVFASTSESVGLARDFAAATLSSWGMDARVQDLQLCVSELAANSVIHGATPGHGFLVRLAASATGVRLEVHDACGRRPQLRHADSMEVSGRGLLIVEEFSDCWGVDDGQPSGKVVWACFREEPC